MDINYVRGILVIVCLLCFGGLCYLAFHKNAKAGFDKAAQLPLADDDLPASPADRKE
ncbi:MAG: CcoQ/FixQ family Cbb3-type cytochrome c oxidase assembly chaperone [Azoarcus sp.]|jgi:cytochrome c oxidase cbb3-type subunit 4|nr:CcoQ/FixQ family Cbb3-type cytochrome c oxidase assembly chaperone [Azoarcus sp.]